MSRGASDDADSVLSLAGQRLCIRQRGEGHPLLLINGLGGNLDMWGPAQERLAETSLTIAIDAPGTGRSSTDRLPRPMPQLARLFARALDTLGHARVDVLGYSWGGLLAQQFARTVPARVRRLALVGTSCGLGSVPGDMRSLALLVTPLRYYSRAFYERTSHLLDGNVAPASRALSRAQAEARRRHPPTLLGYANQLLMGSTWTSLPWLRQVEAPTLVVSGEADRLVPAANGTLLAYHLPESRLHVMPGEGHLLLFDPHSAALPLLRDYFGSPDLVRSQAWRSGTEVSDAASVQHALHGAGGSAPLRALGGLLRGAMGAAPRPGRPDADATQ